MEQVATLRGWIPRRTIVLFVLLPFLATLLLVSTARPAHASGGISYITHTSKANDKKSTGLTLDTPGKIQVGDLLIAAIYVRGKPTVTEPSGWTFIRHNGRGRLYYRVADGNEKVTYKWTLSQEHNAGGSIMVYRGVDPANPIDDDTGEKHPDASTKIVAPSATASVDNTRVVTFFGTGADTHIDPPKDFTERVDNQSTGDGINPLAWEISDKTKDTAGDTSDKTAIAHASASNVGQIVVLAPIASPPDPNPGDPYRAFTDTSYWNTPLSADAPVDPNSANIMSFIESDSTTDYISLSGTSDTGDWGEPIFWAQPGDPVYNVKQTEWTIPPEFASLRIPKDAKTDSTPDSPLTIYDLTAGYVAWLWDAKYDSNTDTWSAGGGSVHYLASNGLDGDWTDVPDTDPRNMGHRGVAGSAFPIRWDEIQAGAINHVLKIGVYHAGCSHVFPMVGDECGSNDPNAPPEGTRIRIKPSVDLSKLGLSSSALIVATALQSYGAVIGDQSGGAVATKVENVVAEGKGWLWNGVLNSTSLSAVPMEDFEVIQLGFRPGDPQLPKLPKDPSAGPSAPQAASAHTNRSPSADHRAARGPSAGHRPTPAPGTRHHVPPPPVEHKAIEFRGSSSARSVGTTLSVPRPASSRTGDFLLATVGLRGHVTARPPNGWTLVRVDGDGSALSVATYYHFVGRGDGSSYAWTLSNPRPAAGAIVAYGGVDAADPIADSSGLVTRSGSIRNAIPAPSVTTTMKWARVVGVFATGSPSSILPPAGFTERVAAGTNRALYMVALECSDWADVMRGATGARWATAPDTGVRVGQMVALNVAGPKRRAVSP